MNKRRVSFFFGVLVIMLISAMVLVGCSTTETEQENSKKTKVITLKYAGDLPLSHIGSEQMDIFKEKVEERTGGSINVELYPAAQLYSSTRMASALSSGAIELGLCDTQHMGGLSEAAAMSAMSFLVKDWPESQTLHKKYFDLIDEEFQAKGIKILYWVPYGVDRGPLTTNKQITKLEDLKGLKMRGIGELSAKWLEAAGAHPIFIDPGETYQALATGTVDGAMSGYGNYYNRRWYETGKYVVGSGFNFCVFVTAVNLDIWNSLPEDIQDILLSTGEEISDECFARIEAEEKEIAAGLEKEGVEIYMLPDEELARWRDLMGPIYDEWADRSLACKQIMDNLRK